MTVKMRKCPYCGGEIYLDSIICMHCKREVPKQTGRCSVCGKLTDIVTVDGKDYCEEHSPKTQAIPIKEASQEQKLTSLTENIILLKKGQDQQNEYLKSIKSSITFFVIIIIIGMLVQLLVSCTG